MPISHSSSRYQITRKMSLWFQVTLVMGKLVFVFRYLKGIAGVYYFRVFFAVKQHCGFYNPAPETRDWTLYRVLAYGTLRSRVRIRKLLKNNYFLHLEKTVCGIMQELSFINIVFITFAITGGFYL